MAIRDDYKDLKDWKCIDCGRRGSSSLRWSSLRWNEAKYKAYCTVCHRSNTVRVTEPYGVSFDVETAKDSGVWFGMDSARAVKSWWPSKSQETFMESWATVRGPKVVKVCPNCKHTIYVYPRSVEKKDTYFGCPDCHHVFYEKEEDMAMKTDPSIPPHSDRVLVNKFRILGTTDDIYYTEEEAVKRARELTLIEGGKRIYVVQVIGYAQPETQPIKYIKLT